MRQKQIKNLLSSLNFDQIEMTASLKPISLSFYDQWLDEGHGAEMDYLAQHRTQKKDLKNLLPKAQSVIVVTCAYKPQHPKPLTGLPHLKLASYAQGEDYHYFFKEKLQHAVNILKNEYPEAHFLTATDSLPILERDFAYQAGLGWFGKNSCLIHEKKGSFFLIGEIITSIKITDDEASSSFHPNRCGTCTRCIDACPTDALSPSKGLDANKCISFWTIESKSIPPLSMAQNFQSWFFGCDICQDVCPWNLKLHGLEKSSHTLSRKEALKDILDILKSSNKSLEKRFKGTPLARPRGFGLKRNALIVALNMNAYEIKEEMAQITFTRPELQHFCDQVLEVLTPLERPSESH